MNKYVGILGTHKLINAYIDTLILVNFTNLPKECDESFISSCGLHEQYLRKKS